MFRNGRQKSGKMSRDFDNLIVYIKDIDGVITEINSKFLCYIC